MTPEQRKKLEDAKKPIPITAAPMGKAGAGKKKQ